jgi:hypothetical protein
MTFKKTKLLRITFWNRAKFIFFSKYASDIAGLCSLVEEMQIYHV